jgi:light-regulated signal transduction histidine kinase (bacteriophytochrome)
MNVASPIDYQQELKEFLKIISHDLRAPVRQIKSFNNMLMKGIELTEKQSLLKGYMDNAIDQVGDQLEGLLKLSRIGSAEVTLTQVNIQILFDEIRAKLSKLIGDEHSFTINIAPNLEVFTDRDRLYCACLEVVSNGLTFHQLDIAAQVHIEASIENDHLVVRVLDKGIGIGEKYYKDIFKPFRRLNHKDEFPNTGPGMGLTFCQKSLIAIDGTVELAKNQQQGCQFIIKVPVSQ